MRVLASAMVTALALFCGHAQASVVTISATTSGCYGGPSGSACSNAADNLPPGALINLIDPVKLTLGAGTYTITNADKSGPFSAWRFNGGSNWAWNFGIATSAGPGQGNVFFVAGSDGVFSSQAAMASANGANRGGPGGPNAALSILQASGGPAAFSASIVLAATTTLNFFVLDYYLPDNAGGVALNIDSVSAPPSVPLPAALPLMVSALGALGLACLKRRKTL